MRKYLLTLICILIPAAIYAQPQERRLSDEEKLLQSMHRYITSDKLFGYIKHLSDSTLFEGRLAGSRGMERAAEWAKELFAEWGLEELPGTSGYVQEYPHPYVEISSADISIQAPVVHTRDGRKAEQAWISKKYPWGQWYAGGTSGNGEVTAEIVYAGYGVTAPELGYDDYKGIDVKGKIVLIEGETPNMSRDRDTLLLWYPYTLHQHKVANAVAHGAVGMLYKWVPGPNNGYDPGFIYAYISQPIVDDIFLGTGRTYDETIKNIRETRKPASFNTGKQATIRMDAVYYPDGKGRNVVGIVRGSDPMLKDEYVIVSGHLDHLGMIPHHIAGANDNNSATAVLMGVAEALARSEAKPRRSVIFINLDGEEAGLTGSQYYADNPLVPKGKVVGVINLEQVGVGENINIGYGAGHPWLEDYFRIANDTYVHRQVNFRSNPHITRPRTDGAVFMKAGYPCVDVGARGGPWRNYYHDPRDDWDTINPEILQDVAKLVYWTAIELANSRDIKP